MLTAPSFRWWISRRPLRLRATGALLATLVLATGTSVARAQSSVFTPIGDLPGGAVGSGAWGISSDGSTVVGRSASANGEEAFRWTETTGLEGLGFDPYGNNFSLGFAASADGSVIVGSNSNFNPIGIGYQMCRWTAGYGWFGLGYLDPDGNFDWSVGYGISANGTVLVGADSTGSSDAAVRWTRTTYLRDIGDLPGGEARSVATATSSDGSVTVGYGNGVNGYEAVRWTGNVMTALSDFPGGFQGSVADAVSADGSVVAGTGNYKVSSEELSQFSDYQAFRWTEATGMVGLGDLPGGAFGSGARAISADGSVIAGHSITSTDANGVNSIEAFFWTQATGMVNLKQYLIANYAPLLPANFAEWKLTSARGVSADGTAIVGQGVDPTGKEQGWLVRLLPKWRTVDIAVNRTDNTSRLLWRERTGRYAVWKLSATGTVQVGKYYGPIAGYVCDQIAVGPSGQTTLLWKNPATRQVALWTLAADLSAIVKATVLSYPAGYAPGYIAVDNDNAIRLSWRKAKSTIALWTINAQTGAITGATTYGPYRQLLDGPLAVGADGNLRLLWKNTETGGATLWTIPSAYGAPSAGYNYNAVPGAVATDIAVGADNKTRLQWAYPSGKVAVWKINTAAGGTGAIETGKFYGPIAGVFPLGLAVGGDNQTRQLWRYPSGAAAGKSALWVLNDSLTTITDADTYGPIP